MIDAGKAWAISRNIGKQGARDPRLLFFAIALPLLIIILFGTVFGGSATRVPLGIVEQGDGPPVTALVARLRAQPNVKVKTYGSIPALRREVRRGRMTAGLVIPASYQAGDDLVMVTQRGRVETSVLRSAVEEVSADRAGDAAGPGARLTYVGSHGGGTRTPTSFAYTSAANLVLFTFVNTLAVGGLLAATRRSGLLRRMLATPTSAATVAVGEAGGRFLIALSQAVGLLAVGSLIFGVRWGEPAAVAAVVVLFAVVSTAAGMLFGTLLNSEEQSVPLAAPIGIALAMLGGCFWSLEDVSPALRFAGHLTPHAWAMDALVVLLYGGGGDAVVRPILVLTVFALVLMVLAARNLRRVVVT